MHELNVGAATNRRRKEDADPVGSEQSRLLYSLYMLYSDLNRSERPREPLKKSGLKTILSRVF